MSVDPFLRVRAIFDAAEELTPTERPEFLDRLCDGDAELRREVESLLEARAGLGSFLDDGPAAWKGRRIGAYIVRDVVAEGGMGLVLRATQEQPRRDVAIKLVRATLFTDDMLRRFALEAEVLGRLDHPGIADIYEASTFQGEHGAQPYLVMEFIEGLSLTSFVRKHELSTRARVELLARICEAVHHAHLRGVIHRDLKPSNIMVREDGTPKILDFGVARVIDSETEMTTMHTRAGQMIGTLPYMSPEQVRGSHAELDARSDVYSLGVLLFEMLSGSLPYDLEDTELVEAARIINEGRPSSLEDTGVNGAAELDVIVGKCLRKEAANRYDSAAELARDLRRFLDNEPIQARPPSATYQLRKFARRNRGLVASAGVALVTLVGALAFSTAGWSEAARERGRTQLEADRAHAVNSLLTEILAAPDPYQQGTEVKVVDVLGRAQELVAGRYSEHPLVAARVHDTLGETYHGMNLLEQAEGQWRLALLNFERGHADRSHPETVLARASLARVFIDVGNLDAADSLVAQFEVDLERLDRGSDAYYRASFALIDLAEFRGDFETAVALARNARDTAQRELEPENPMHLDCTQTLGNLLWQAGRPEEAREYQEFVAEHHRATFGESHPTTLIATSNLAMVYKALDETERALEVLQRVLQIRTEQAEGPTQDLATSNHNIGDMLRKCGRPQEALAHHREAIRMGEDTMAPDDIRRFIFQLGYGRSLRVVGQKREAAPFYESGVRALVKSYGTGNANVRAAVEDLADLFEELGDQPKAREIAALLPSN